MENTQNEGEKNISDFNLENVLENLYNINKHAKKYKRLGTENYKKGKKTTAKANSLKKEALYSLKEEILKEIKDYINKADIHIIDNNKFYCLYFEDYTFHIPIQKININEKNINKTERLDEFESGERKEYTNLTLKQSLQYFKEKFDQNANDYLLPKYLSWGHQQYFIGWEYLSDKY